MSLWWCSADYAVAEIVPPNEPAWDGQTDEEFTLCIGDPRDGVALIGDLEGIERFLVRALTTVHNARG
jgi:hypothetical protein